MVYYQCILCIKVQLYMQRSRGSILFFLFIPRHYFLPFKLNILPLQPKQVLRAFLNRQNIFIYAFLTCKYILLAHCSKVYTCYEKRNYFLSFIVYLINKFTIYKCPNWWQLIFYLFSAWINHDLSNRKYLVN